MQHTLAGQTTPRSLPSDVHRLVRPAWMWVLERGVLYGLLETPILAVIGGYFFRVVPYPFASISVLLAFMALPTWLAYRRSVSTNPAEPVHHIHRYAIYALLPGAMFTVARIPANLTLGVIYWHPWYDFGSALTGAPVGQYDSLLAGAVLNALQGWSIGIGYYVLFQRHSLLNAVLYICVYDSALYSYVFPTYSRVGLQSPPLWHAVMAWGHFWMAVTAWLVPRFAAVVWPRSLLPARVAAVALGALIVLSPTAFAFWRAATWQFPRQESIDLGVFDRPGLVAYGQDPTVVVAGSDARYDYTLRFGPRAYHNYFNQVRALDAGPVRVRGRLWHDGQVIAWCSAAVDRLETPNVIASPLDFEPAMRRLEFTPIPVACVGPAAAVAGLGRDPTVTVEWNVRMTLTGGRLRQSRSFAGSRVARVTDSHPAAGVTS